MFNNGTEVKSDEMWLSEALTFCGLDMKYVTQEVKAIITKYTESHRRYHTFIHIRNMTSYWENLIRDTDISHETTVDVLLAILFHDIIYDTKWSRKIILEEASAQEFITFCERTHLDISSERINHVANLIRSTATHTPMDNDQAALAFLDSDMYILSIDRHQYIEYARQVRDEWAHIDDATYVRGRMNFLIGVLETPRIYFTDNMINREDIARDNMRYELKLLDPANNP